MAKSKVLKSIRNDVQSKMERFNNVISYKGILVPEKSKEELISELMSKFELVLKK